MVVEGPSAEQIKHKEIGEAAAKAWEGVIAMGVEAPDSGMKIKEVLTI